MAIAKSLKIALFTVQNQPTFAATENTRHSVTMMEGVDGMRLIDADVAKENISNAILGDSEFAQDTRNTCYKAIDNTITIGSALVVHGKWIDTGSYVTTAYGSLDIYKCSNCNKEITIDGADSYCPSCGAKMDIK